MVRASNFSRRTAGAEQRTHRYCADWRSGGIRAVATGSVAEWCVNPDSDFGELVYDVINQKGELFERVRVPKGRSIAGFGNGGVVYLMYCDTATGWFFERTRVVR